MMDREQLGCEVIALCRRLCAAGYISGTWGNVSVRLEDGNILMTPSRVEYDAMVPADMAVLTPAGERVAGSRLPTSEREIHRGILNVRPDVGAVIHTHSPHAQAVAALGLEIPPLSEEMCQLLGGAVPVTGRFVPSQEHVRLGEEVTLAIGKRNAVLIRNHGVVCCGRTLAETEVCAQVTEKAAQVFLLLLSSGQQIRALEEPFISMNRRYFLESYGKT